MSYRIALGALWLAGCHTTDGVDVEERDLAAGLDGLPVEISCGAFTPPASPYEVTLDAEQYCGCAREVSLETLCGPLTDVYLAPDGAAGGAGTAGDPVDGLVAAHALCADAPCRLHAAEGTYATMDLPDLPYGEPGYLTFTACASLQGGLHRADWTAGGADSVFDVGAGFLQFEGHAKVEDVTVDSSAGSSYRIRLVPADGVGGTFGLVDRVALSDELNVHNNAGPVFVCDSALSGPGPGVNVHKSSNAVVEGVEATMSGEAAFSVNTSSNVVIRGSTASSPSPVSFAGPSTDVAILGNVLDSSGTYAVTVSGDSQAIHIEGNDVWSTDPGTSPLPEPDPVREITVVNNTETIR